jgi:GntR family transcriptional regulator
MLACMKGRPPEKHVLPKASKLSADAAMPLYHQLFLSLRDDIRSGKLPVGAAVPGELVLAERFGVSRITARRALNDLAAHGYVERRRRAGTRVLPRLVTAPLEGSIDQAVEALLTFGRNTHARVVSVSAVPADQCAAALLKLSDGDAIIRAVRIREMDGMPLGIVVSQVPAAIAGQALTPKSLEGSSILATLAGIGWHAGDATQTISAQSADMETAALLGIDLGAALLRVERLVSDKQGRAFLHTVATYRADRYRVRIDLHDAQLTPVPEAQ